MKPWSEMPALLECAGEWKLPCAFLLVDWMKKEITYERNGRP
jgi:hypothetical protein